MVPEAGGPESIQVKLRYEIGGGYVAIALLDRVQHAALTVDDEHASRFSVICDLDHQFDPLWGLSLPE